MILKFEAKVSEQSESKNILTLKDINNNIYKIKDCND